MVKSLSLRVRGPNFGKGSVLFLALPRELRDKMFNGIVLIGSPHLTQRALDAGESARFSGIFFASAFFSVDGVPPSVPAQVTQTVGCLTFHKETINNASIRVMVTYHSWIYRWCD